MGPMGPSLLSLSTGPVPSSCSVSLLRPRHVSPSNTCLACFILACSRVPLTAIVVRLVCLAASFPLRSLHCVLNNRWCEKAVRRDKSPQTLTAPEAPVIRPRSSSSRPIDSKPSRSPSAYSTNLDSSGARRPKTQTPARPVSGARELCSFSCRLSARKMLADNAYGLSSLGCDTDIALYAPVDAGGTPRRTLALFSSPRPFS